MFCFRKKKKNTAKIFVILGIVIGVAAAAVGGYFLFTKFLKDKLCKKKACDQIADEACDCCEETCDACEEIEEIIEDVEE
ncbi:MAG: hypothetical protein IJD38_01825 [Clostridia bacterium]|nr:hypothetical protein [Clostridia bacterium]